MDVTIKPGKLSGTVSVIPSKSQAHRFLICAALADKPTDLICSDTNQDIETTVECLRTLGANIVRTTQGYRIEPFHIVPESVVLNCRESGSTLRFLLPIVGALGVDAVFHLEGRLPQRPLSPLWEEMERMGCILSRPSSHSIRCQGKLRYGTFHISGNVSSQFISGLLFALALLDGDSKIEILGKLESQPYILMTQRALMLFGISTRDYVITGGQQFHTPGILNIEGDWSNGAFWLAAQALGSNLCVNNLDPDSPQGDRLASYWLKKLNDYCVISSADIPDLIPILAVVAGANQGALFTDIKRLRLKESDRVKSICAMIRSLGGRAEETEDTIKVYGTGFWGGIVDSFYDHRIAMSAAIASTVCTEAVTILGAESVIKSYPQFWNEFTRLGGKL